MHNNRTYLPAFIGLFVFCIGLVAVYPYYCYYVDSDGTAYLTIAKQYAVGNFARAVNAYWSPMACWLTAMLMKITGWEVFMSAVVVNAMGAASVLFMMQSMLLLFDVNKKLQWILNLSLGSFLVYAVFKQSFDDLWQCFLLLSCLRLLLADNYIKRPGLWIGMGMLGALAYFSKAYAFPFFLINTACCSYYLCKQNAARFQWIKITLVSVSVMLVCALPWIYQLHLKYGGWMTSSSGTLNLSWYVVGHPFWKDGIQYLLPVQYAGSPSYWEDPWWVNGARPHFWDSFSMLAIQIVRIVYNLLKMVICMNEQSPFVFVLWALGMSKLLTRRLRMFAGDKLFIVIVSFLLFPTGYMLVNFEARYIWYMLFLSLVAGAVLLDRYWLRFDARTITLASLLFAASYLAWPVWDMKLMYRKGEEQYQIAQALRQAGIKGNFTANVVFGNDEFEEAQQIAYFSGNSFYDMPYADIPYEGLLNDMRRYNVKYYFYFYHSPTDARDYVMRDEKGIPFTEVPLKNVQGLKVFEVIH